MIALPRPQHRPLATALLTVKLYGAPVDAPHRQLPPPRGPQLRLVATPDPEPVRQPRLLLWMLPAEPLEVRGGPDTIPIRVRRESRS